MKLVAKFCLRACASTVLLLTLFCLFISVLDFETQSITIANFFVILLFGFIISGAEVMYKLLNINKIAKSFIHYFVLLCTFFIVFIVSGNLVIRGVGTVFAAIVFFTVLYFIVLLIVYFVGCGINNIDSSCKNKSEKQAKNDDKKAGYTPRFK
jgi:hypothetical protein